MKKQKRKETKAVPEALVSPAAKRWPSWWIWLAGFGALFAVFEAYTPALNGPFVLDDLYLPFTDVNAPSHGLLFWITLARPLLMFSFFVDYTRGAPNDTYPYHFTNVALHFIVSLVVMFIAARLLSFVNVEARVRKVLAAFSGALFLLHPLQTESVAYIASRSEVLSVLFYYSAFAIFLYAESMTFLRAVAIVALFGAAAATKEHTLTLPVLLIFTDYVWNRGGLRKNGLLYGLLAAACAAGGVVVWRVLQHADTAGLHVKDMTPMSYFFTQCRVIWIYIRMFFLPFGLNVDPDIPQSATLLDHGAIVGLIALIALAATAWIYRKRWPLAAYGVFVFLLLIAPTSSFLPIRDVLAEHRMYLPLIGLIFVCLEFLHRIQFKQAAWTVAAATVICIVLTYQRAGVWSSALALWQDSVSKSPNKMRPRFQLAFAEYQAGEYAEAAETYAAAARLEKPDHLLLVDWANALDAIGRENEAEEKLKQAAAIRGCPDVLLGAIYAKQRKFDDALAALDMTEKCDPGIAQIYVNRGGVYQFKGDRAAAVREYQRALAIDPSNKDARAQLQRLTH